MCILYCCEGRKLDNYWVITTPSLNKEYCIVLYFAFNLPNYVTSYKHYSGKKKNKVTKNLLPGDSNPDPPISKN